MDWLDKILFSVLSRHQRLPQWSDQKVEGQWIVYMLGLSSGCCCPSAGSEPCDTVDAGWAKDDRFSETCSTAIDAPGGVDDG